MRQAGLTDLGFRGAPKGLDRAALARAIDGWGLARLFLSFRRASRLLTVLTYHRVVNAIESAGPDEGVVDATVDQLDRQVAFVKRWFEVVTTDEVCAFVAGRAALPPRPLMISFDDGYRDNHDAALPILLKYGVRGTFFVATRYVEERRIYWWDRIALVIGRSRKPRLRLTYPREESLPIDAPALKRRAVRRAQRIVKDERGLDLARFLEQLEIAAGVGLAVDEERRLADALVMTWDHVAALKSAGMDVQSHTHSHRALQTLGAEDLDRELRTSRAILQRVLGAPVHALSYPIGKPVRGSPEIVQAARAAGYELGFSNGTGVSPIRSLDPFDIKRLSMDRSMPDSFFRAMLAVPWLAHRGP